MNARQQHTAIAYDKRGRVISIGKNSYCRTHPLQAKYASKSGNADKVYIHAEIDALVRAKSRKIHSIFVSRLDAHGNYVLSKPCASCMLALADFNISIIGHT